MIHLRRVCIVISIFVALVPAIYGQTPQGPTPEISLSVSGEVERTLKLTAADLGIFGKTRRVSTASGSERHSD